MPEDVDGLNEKTPSKEDDIFLTIKNIVEITDEEKYKIERDKFVDDRLNELKL